MNDDNTSLSMLNNVCTEQQVGQVMANRRYSGLTPFGTKLRQKVIDGIVLPKLRQPRKPFLVIGITDGRPQGEDPSVLEDTVRYAVNSTQKLGRGAVVPLDHRVGEPVDVVVNGRVVARGEVVVVEEDNSRFGVSLTEIVGPLGQSDS